MPVALDLDDTLYLEREFVTSGFEVVADELSDQLDVSSPHIFEILQSDFEQGIRGDNFDRLVEQLDEQVRVGPLVERYRDHVPEIKLLDDARVCLETLSDNGYSTAIITDGEETKQRRKLGALELNSRVDETYISGEFDGDAGKPSPVMFESFLEAFDEEPENTVYVGDNAAKDFVAPNELGMYSVWVRRVDGEYRREKPSCSSERPTAAVSDLRELPELLSEWGIDS